MNFIDKKNVVLFQIRQKRRQIARPLNRRSARDTEIHAELIGDDIRQRRLAQPRRPVEQHMIQRLFTRTRRFDVHGYIFAQIRLPDIFFQHFGAKRLLPRVFPRFLTRHDPRLFRLLRAFFVAKTFDFFNHLRFPPRPISRSTAPIKDAASVAVGASSPITPATSAVS